MSRKELYDKIKELGLADAIKKKFGDNYTRVSSSNLENFIKAHLKCDKKEKKEEVVVDKVTEAPSKIPSNPKCCKEAIIKLVSILQTKRIITAKEAEEVVELLK